MSEPFPAIAETAATGNAQEVFADIRATIGGRVVNLVWCHLATLDGRLGTLAGERPASVDAVLASYDHSNTRNLFAFGALS